MRAKLVTAYVPIPDHPRTAEEYGAYGEKLGGVPVPKKCFYNTLDQLWLTKYLSRLKYTPRSSEHDNPAKNTLAYHAVQHQKSTWLQQAADEDPDADILVWVDYGIFRLPGISNQVIYEFMEKLDDKAIYIPGCWDKPSVIESAYPCWRFCGCVVAVPRRLVGDFDFQCRTVARDHITATKNVEWEVNTWARVERLGRLPIHWYAADHNGSAFTNLTLDITPPKPEPALIGSTHLGRMARSTS
jgi:hypothetical protein